MDGDGLTSDSAAAGTSDGGFGRGHVEHHDATDAVRQEPAQPLPPPAASPPVPPSLAPVPTTSQWEQYADEYRVIQRDRAKQSHAGWVIMKFMVKAAVRRRKAQEAPPPKTERVNPRTTQGRLRKWLKGEGLESCGISSRTRARAADGIIALVESIVSGQTAGFMDTLNLRCRVGGSSLKSLRGKVRIRGFLDALGAARGLTSLDLRDNGLGPDALAVIAGLLAETVRGSGRWNR